MSIILTDRMTFDAPKRTKEGYMAVRARSARVGIQDYMGYEVDPSGSKFQANDVVKVYRPETEVMAEKSVRSFIGRPVTDGHPPEAVNSSNWKQYADGVIMGAIRDGDHLAFDIVFMDENAVTDIATGGPRELSNGYGVDLSFEDGVTPSGETYQAIQRNIVGNHVARVPRGRAGPTCAIAACDAMSEPQINSILVHGDRKPMKTILVDGHSVEVSDAAEIAIAGLNKKLADAAKTAADLVTAQTQIGTLTATISTKDGEIAGLTQKLKDATALDLDKLMADREAVVTAAKSIFPTLDAKGKTVDVIRKEAVVHKLADAAKDMDDNAIRGAFAALTVTADATDTMRDGIRQIDHSTQTNDARSGYLDRMQRKTTKAA